MNNYSMRPFGRIFVASNTPSFLIRKLRETITIQTMAREEIPADILEALSQSLKDGSPELDARVAPYAFLAALAIKADRLILNRAATLAAPHHEWYPYIAKKIAGSQVPTARSSIQVPSFGSAAARSSVNTSTLILGVGHGD